MKRALLVISMLCARAPAASAHEAGYTLRGFGTPAIDGVVTAGEWDAAGKLEFAANRLPEDGGGTSPATLFVMNDAANLYAAVRVQRDRLGSSSIALEFDSDHDDQLLENGEDVLVLNPPMLFDDFRTNQPPCTGGWCGLFDTDAGGTNDGTGAARNDGSFSVYELSHPLNSADDSHDFSLGIGNRIGFAFSLRFCSSTCVDTEVPGRGRGTGDIVITSLNRTPPDTEITSGPAEGSVTDEPVARFEFTGRDDVIRPQDLTFECRLDEAAFLPCNGPVETELMRDGSHSFAVRATDEALNVDPSPAIRRWTIDSAPPTRPTVRGPRKTKQRSATYRLAARDEIDSPSQLRFRCAVNSRRFRVCARRVRVRLRPGQNLIRVVAWDRAENVSEPQVVKVRRVRAGPSRR